jgi:hypothetical protein
MSALRVGGSALLLILPATTAAQESSGADTIPFRSGQWAALFSGGLSFASLGLMRFSTPTRAWVLDFRLAGGHGHDTNRINDTLTIESFTSTANISARVGRRFYQGRGKAVASFQTVGVLSGFNHQCGGSTLGGTTCDKGWTGGAFGELGAAYLVTPRLSIGGTAGVQFSYTRGTVKNTRGAIDKHWAYQGSLQGLSFAASLYF